MMRARKSEERMNQGRQQSLLLSLGTLSTRATLFHCPANSKKLEIVRKRLTIYLDVAIVSNKKRNLLKENKQIHVWVTVNIQTWLCIVQPFSHIAQ
jgi:hypothetical protein